MKIVRIRTLFLAAALLAIMSVEANAYPVSGTWTYDNATAAGPAKECGRRQMRFEGLMRYDTETSIPSYRNLSVEKAGNTTYRVVDQVYNMMQWGKLQFTLQV